MCFSFVHQWFIVNSSLYQHVLFSWASISAIGHIGFRFAPKLHGILTKAQAVGVLSNFGIAS
jgi:hypothetical protein